MANENKWKDYLLKSGIPLEYEIMEFLSKKNCISDFDYTYFRQDQLNHLTEFSYDIDSSFIEPPHFINLMIECKYRHETTKWLFLPECYDGTDEIFYTSFMHPNNHFCEKGDYWLGDFPSEFAPLCSKGIEITTDGQNPKTITQATSQLAYAMAEKITIGMQHQIDGLLGNHFKNTIFYNIPIIITTAELYRINENSSIDIIKASNNIEEIATKENCLIVKNNKSVNLKDYNYSIFQDFISEFGREKLEKHLNSFNTDLDFVMSVISEHYCPSCFVVIHHSKENIAFEELFNYIKRVFKPDKEVIDLIKDKKSRAKEIFEKLGIKIPPRLGED
jgi:hypothetical protein